MASFDAYAVGVDSSLSLFVADVNNNVIRKITTSQLVTTYSGSGSGGSLDGSLSVASFNQPIGIFVAPDSTIHVVQRDNHIRRISSSGSVTLVAGSTNGFLDGIGSSARFSGPIAVFENSKGSLFVADRYNNRIRQIISGKVHYHFLSSSSIIKMCTVGVVSTIAGSGFKGYRDGVGTLANFSEPCGIIQNNVGDLVVSDFQNFVLRKIDSMRMVTLLAGSVAGQADGLGSLAKFSKVVGIALDARTNTYLVADFYGHRIRRVTSNGLVTTVAGNGYSLSVNGIGTSSSFWFPSSISVDSIGNAYVVEKFGTVIRKLTRK